MLLTAEDIAKRNAHSVQELLNTVPGVQAGQSSVSIRGSYKVRVLLDGMVLNDPGTFSVNLSLVPFHNLATVEIFKGGGGVAFGDDASGGAVVFATTRLEQTRVFSELSGGSQDAYGAKFDLSHRQGGLGVGVSGEYQESAGYRRNGDKEERRMGARFSYRPQSWGEGREPTLAIDFGEIRKGFAGYPEYPTPNSRGIDESLGVSFTWDNWGITSGTYLTRFEQTRRDTDKGTHTMLRTTNLRQQLARTWEVWGVKGIDTGLNLESTLGQGSELETTQESVIGLFVRKRIDFSFMPLSLLLGLRANVYSAFDNVLNPELELMLPLDQHRFKLALSRSNNLPSLRQRYFRYSAMEPNPDLVMEKAANITFGVASNWLPWVSSDISLFNREIDNRITYVRLEGGVGQYQNFGSTRLRGVELSLDIKPAQWVSFKPSYTYLEAIDRETGLWLSSKPRHKIKADLRITPLAGLSLGFFYTYESMRYTNSSNTESAAAYHILDLRAEYQRWGFSFFATCENIFDQSYMYGDGYPAPPRTWMVGLSREF